MDKSVLDYYVAQKSIPGGTLRNWESYGHKIAGVSDYQRAYLADPQTSGGLLMAVDVAHVTDFQSFMRSKGFDLESFGFFIDKCDIAVTVV
jgi:selenide, water dikinase